MATILCIEDDRLMLATLKDALVELGHEVEPASSVDEGLHALDQRDVDLVISDFRMPDATGLSFLDALRQRGSRVPVIIVTGYSSLENAIVSMQRGAAGYLVKPLERETLRIAVMNALQVDELRRAGR
jgi:DNA-binding NtrC family response regulator